MVVDVFQFTDDRVIKRDWRGTVYVDDNDGDDYIRAVFSCVQVTDTGVYN